MAEWEALPLCRSFLLILSLGGGGPFRVIMWVSVTLCTPSAGQGQVYPHLGPKGRMQQGAKILGAGRGGEGKGPGQRAPALHAWNGALQNTLPLHQAGTRLVSARPGGRGTECSMLSPPSRCFLACPANLPGLQYVLQCEEWVPVSSGELSWLFLIWMVTQ